MLRKHNIFLRILLTLIISLYLLPAYADGPTTAQSMIVNIATQIPNLMRLVTSFAYVMGMYFIFHGVVKLKHAGEMRTQMSHEHSLMGPILFLIVGGCLLYLPTAVQVGMSTFWTNPSPYGYLEQQDQWTQFFNDCFMIVQLVGTIAFIKGLIMLSHAGGQQGTFGKGMTHLIGGIFCLNIYQTVQMILATLGVQSPF
jgi:hypothetical protein